MVQLQGMGSVDVSPCVAPEHWAGQVCPNTNLADRPGGFSGTQTEGSSWALRTACEVGDTSSMWSTIMKTLERAATETAGLTPDVARRFWGRGTVRMEKIRAGRNPANESQTPDVPSVEERKMQKQARRLRWVADAVRRAPHLTFRDWTREARQPLEAAIGEHECVAIDPDLVD